MLRGPGRILDHRGLLRVFVVMGVLAATALSFNVIKTGPSSGDVNGSSSTTSLIQNSVVTCPVLGGPDQTPGGQQQTNGPQNVGNAGNSGDPAPSACPTSTTTTPVPPKSTLLGGTWSDSAKVTTSPTVPAPTGTVTFYVCSPAQLKGSSSCTSSGTQIPSGGGITNPVTLTQGTTSSTATSPPFTPPSAGQWCFAGYYSGLTGTYVPSSDTSSDECFTVEPLTPGLTTHVTAPTSTAVGNSWTDSATVAGNATGGVPAGSVSFTWCKETTSSPCTGTTGGGTLPPVTSSTSGTDSSTFGPSNSVTPTSVGTYCFNASYSAQTGGNYTSVSTESNPTGECFTVSTATPTLATTVNAPPGNPPNTAVGNSWSDSATVTGNPAGGAPAGSVSFTWCKETTSSPCTGTTGGGTLPPVTSSTSTSDSSTFGPSNSVTPTSVGTYCFNASYSAQTNGNYVSVSTESNPAAECFTVTAAKSTTSTQQTITESGPASIVIGAQGSVSDTVTVLGNPTGGPPTGSVSFYICYFPSGGYNLCPSSWGKALGSKTLHSTGSDTSGTTSAAYPMLNRVGTYCFSASYTPDSTSNYKGSSDNMAGTVDDNECVTVNPAVPGFTTTMDQPKDPSVGNSWRDWATLTGNPTAGAPTGWVTFTWCRATWPTFTCTGTKGGGWAGTVNVLKQSGDASIFGPSATVTPTHVGVYCFNARYDATKGGAYVSVEQQTDRECFTVEPAASVTRTQQSGSDTGEADIALGGSVTDTATVTGNPTGGPPTGWVTFEVCGPTWSPSTCDHGTKVDGPATLKASGPDTSSATSKPFTPDAIGTYCFAAVYWPAPDANYLGSSDNKPGFEYSTDNNRRDSVDVNECFFVGRPSFRVLKTDVPGNGQTVNAGATIPYTVKIQNVGNAPGTAIVTDALPANLTMKVPPACAVTSPDTCAVANTVPGTPNGGTWTFTVGLAAGDTATVTFTATVSPTDRTDVVNTATVTTGRCYNSTTRGDDGGTGGDGSTGATGPVEDVPSNAVVDNCSSTVSNPVAAFTVLKTDKPGANVPVTPGQSIPYTVTVTNVGSGTGSATVTDNLPSNLVLMVSPACGPITLPDTCTVVLAPTKTSWTATVGLAPGHSATVNFSAQVSASAASGSAVVNVATITDPCVPTPGCSFSSVSNPVLVTSAATTPPSQASPIATSPSSTGPTTSASTLAFTGAYLARLGLFALTLLGFGSALVLLARRRRPVGKHARG